MTLNMDDIELIEDVEDLMDEVQQHRSGIPVPTPEEWKRKCERTDRDILLDILGKEDPSDFLHKGRFVFIMDHDYDDFREDCGDCSSHGDACSKHGFRIEVTTEIGLQDPDLPENARVWVKRMLASQQGAN